MPAASKTSVGLALIGTRTRMGVGRTWIAPKVTGWRIGVRRGTERIGSNKWWTNAIWPNGNFSCSVPEWVEANCVTHVVALFY